MRITLNGIEIDYETSGSGKNVLLLHGWGCTKEIFASVTQALAKDFRVTALDFPGFGKSGAPGAHYGVSEYMELTAEFIRQTGLTSTDVICHSFGGRVMIKLAAKYPELIGKIIFTDAAGLKKKRTLGYYLKVYRYKLMKRISKGRFIKGLIKKLGIDVDARVKNAGSADYKALPEAMKQIFIRVVNEDLRPYLKSIKAPSLLIWGENDTDTPVEFGRVMEKEIPDAGLVVLPNAGHYVFLDQFARYITVVRHFLGG